MKQIKPGLTTITTTRCVPRKCMHIQLVFVHSRYKAIYIGVHYGRYKTIPSFLRLIQLAL